MAAAANPIESILAAAVEIGRETERRAYVEQACAGDPELKRRVDELIDNHFQAGSFLESPAPDLGATTDQPVAERPGTVIGLYKLLEQIGEGGFGTVFLAEQTHPVRRKVALKVIKAGMDTKQVIARFEAERQALAVLDHPHIAKVFDGGQTAGGRPFFVMELVRGVPITDYCDQAHLPPRDRLDLFLQVCQAVQHAHQKGIIHRDIKPSNVLVSAHDGRPAVKVIDFGIAKATGHQLTDKTLFTGFAQMMGTPLYMSPEQAAQSPDIDTRSDIYSLGVLLYELLTGSTPFTKERFRQAAFDEIRRIIREEEPPRPSTRLSESKDSLPSISAQRHTEPGKLTRLFRGEVDWIVMKALEKDRGRRYETANAFAADVQRYLADEPVLAGPPGTSYRLRKFVRRNRGPVLAVGLVVLVLVAGIVGTTWAMVEARRRAEGERQAKERAEANFALADEAVGKYLGAVTDDPGLKQPDFTRLRKKLLEGAIPFFQKIVAQKGDDPAVEAERGQAYLRLARLRLGLEEDGAALQDAEAMHEIFARLAADSPTRAHRHGLANSLHTRAIALERLLRLDEAEADFRQAIDLMEALVAESPTDPRAREDLAHAHNDLGFMLYRRTRLRAVEPALRRAVGLLEELAAAFPEAPGYRRTLADSESLLGGLLADLGEPGKGVAAIRRALDVQGELVAAFPNELDDREALADQWNELGRVHSQQWEFAKAEAAFREALGIREKLAAALPAVLRYRRTLADSHNNLVNALGGQGKLPEAEAAVREALGIREKLAAAFPTAARDQMAVSDSQVSLGIVLTQMGKLPGAKAAYLQAIKIKEKLAAANPEQPAYAVHLGGAYCNFGLLLSQSGEPGSALDWFDRAIARLEKVLSHDRRQVTARQFLGNAVAGRADVLDALGRHADAVADRKHALELDDGRARDGLRLKLALSRLWAARKAKDAARCLAAADEFEVLAGTDAGWLYDAACARAICAAVIPLDPKTPAAGAAPLAKEQADRAMAWLHKAVAAGYDNAAHMKEDKDLDALSGREDFKKLVTGLEAKKK